ncbi:hypothetical protein M3Y94_01095100 [Aphelenchoides besseyi]|nr:hypothetical protein M3Y94_01095100 [Aphelenchoides besseyi]
MWKKVHFERLKKPRMSVSDVAKAAKYE